MSPTTITILRPTRYALYICLFIFLFGGFLCVWFLIIDNVQQGDGHQSKNTRMSHIYTNTSSKIRNVCGYDDMKRPYTSCPGWHDYKEGLGCLEEIPCRVQISQKASRHCKAKREKQLSIVQSIYKLGTLPGLPVAATDIDTMEALKLYLADPFTKTWMQLYLNMMKFTERVLESFSLKFQKEFTSVGDYERLFYWLVQELKHDPTLRPSKLFRFPLDTIPFKNVVNNSTWREDEVFAQLRLAGLNPMCIQRVSAEQDIGVKWSELLANRLNKRFNWATAIQKAFGKPSSLQMMISDGSVFVCHFPLFDNLVNVPDIMEPRPSRKMWPSMSPIAVFVSREGELVPAAIQVDYKPDSPVYTPEDGDLWTLAKEAFQATDLVYAEMVEHLLKTHFIMEPFCTSINRHISFLHPLHQIMKFHCRGIVSNNKVGVPMLLEANGAMHKLFAIGNNGSMQLFIKAYYTMTWKDTDFRRNIQHRGLDDKKKLPYFPYRDDGELLYRLIYSFVDEYISHYYRNDGDVANDTELQAFSNEMSADGAGEDGGNGKMRGFPTQITTRDLLKDIVTRLIWTASAQHSAVNYPVIPYGAFTPSTPCKIYEDIRVPKNTFNVYRLPNGNTSLIAVSLVLGSLHFDDLLDYGPLLADKPGRDIVTKHYNHLVNHVKNQMDDRNKKRYQRGYLTYPWLTPGWIPNSIST